MEWIKFLENNWDIIKRAPWAFIIIAGLAAYGGFKVARLIDSTKIDNQADEIHRLHVALGVDPASKGNLVELKNSELKPLSLTVAAKARNACLDGQIKINDKFRLIDKEKMDPKDAARAKGDVLNEASRNFDPALLADAYNLDNELRRRLGPEAVSTIPGIPRSLIAGDTQIDPLTLFPGMQGNDVLFSCTIADAIERMARVLPDEGK